MRNFWETLKKPIVGLAPMDGITDYPARQIQCSVAKPDVIYTEFVSVEGFTRNSEAFKRKLFFEENERPIVAQIFGYTPELFYETITRINELSFDGIDINMGCPAKSVTQKGGGGNLIGNYQLAEKIIDFSIQAIKDTGKDVLLSVKTRIGKSKIITKDWVSFLSLFPLSEVTIHGRLLKQNRSGEVNWNEIRKASEILHSKKIVCLGNGGIKSQFEAKEKSKNYGLDGVLIGQAALGNPWVFSDRQPTQNEILDTIIRHTEYVSDFYPPERFVTALKHFSWYPRDFPNCTKLKIELLKTRNYQQVKEVIESFKKNYGR